MEDKIYEKAREIKYKIDLLESDIKRINEIKSNLDVENGNYELSQFGFSIYNERLDESKSFFFDFYCNYPYPESIKSMAENFFIQTLETLENEYKKLQEEFQNL